MRRNLWLLGATGLAVLVATSTANAQRLRGRAASWGVNYGQPYLGYGYRPNAIYNGYRGGYYTQPDYSYSRPVVSTPYYSGTTYYTRTPTTYYSQPLYSINDTAGATIEQATPVASIEQSSYVSPTVSAPNGMITILVPDQAQVWFGNILTTVQGSSRSFQLPLLDSGRDYTYTIRAKWAENGQDRDQTKAVTFRAGQSFTVDMRTAAATVTNPAPLQPTQPIYSTNDPAGQVIEQGTQVASIEQSNYYSPTVTAQNGMITILVPDQAQVWFGDVPTSLRGSSRSFQLPPLDSGRDYSYTIRAKWMENGRERDQTKVVTFRAGQAFSVDMRTPPNTVANPPVPPPAR